MKKARRAQDDATLTITSMMDMMTIILVFLLKSYSTTDISVKPDGNLTLPASTTVSPPKKAVQVLVAKNRILVDDGRETIEVFELEYNPATDEIQIPAAEISTTQPLMLDGENSLFNVLENARISIEEKGKATGTDFEGEVLLQVDKDISFDVVHRVMFTAGQAQFSEFQFVVIKSGE